MRPESSKCSHGATSGDCYKCSSDPYIRLHGFPIPGEIRHEMGQCYKCRQEVIIMPASGKVVHGHSIGGKRSPEHCAWHNLLQRCTNPNHPRYSDWGGRGITVCDRWQGINGFSNFLTDMGRKPSPKHSIGRINNNGNYEPNNCRWETSSQQTNNARSNVLVTFNGKTQNVMQWSKEMNIPYLTLLKRVNSGWSAELALTTKVRVGQKVKKRY